MLFDVSEKARKVLESYFHLETPLYFSYTHLVCRSAIDGTISAPQSSSDAHACACFHPTLLLSTSGKQGERADLSHPVHADNCLLVSEMNECVKEPPAYTHRDYR